MSTNDGYLGYTKFPMQSYIKTMSADAGHLELRFGSGNIILKVHHPRTIHANACFKSSNWFQRKKLDIFPTGSYVKTMSADGDHLEYGIGTKKIVDYPCNVCFKLVNWCQSRKFSHIFR